MSIEIENTGATVGVDGVEQDHKVWWKLGSENPPPDAVRALYATLPREVGQACERARKRMGTGYLAYIGGLRDACDALAPDGKFKAWCEAYGLNYGTVKNQLSQADSKLPNNKPLPGPLPKGASQLVLDAEGVETDDYVRAVVYLLDFCHEHTTGVAA